MINPITITKAWAKVYKGITTSEDKRRAGICKGCDKSEHMSFLDFVNDELKDAKGMVCTICYCPISAKIRSTDKCYKWE